MNPHSKFPWLWDVDMDADTFRRILEDRAEVDGRDWKWAMVRLIEYAPYPEIRRLLPEELFLEHWHEVSSRVRSDMRREGMDYLHQRLSERKAA